MNSSSYQTTNALHLFNLSQRNHVCEPMIAPTTLLGALYQGNSAQLKRRLSCMSEPQSCGSSVINPIKPLRSHSSDYSSIKSLKARRYFQPKFKLMNCRRGITAKPFESFKKFGMQKPVLEKYYESASTSQNSCSPPEKFRYYNSTICPGKPRLEDVAEFNAIQLRWQRDQRTLHHNSPGYLASKVPKIKSQTRNQDQNPTKSEPKTLASSQENSSVQAVWPTIRKISNVSDCNSFYDNELSPNHSALGSGAINMIRNLQEKKTGDNSEDQTYSDHDNCKNNLEKPIYSYAGLIGQAIMDSACKKASLNEIYSYISRNYPFYKMENPGWQNSIRHNLSLNESFMKVPRKPYEPGKGSYWAIVPGAEYQFVNGGFKKKTVESDRISNRNAMSLSIRNCGKERIRKASEVNTISIKSSYKYENSNGCIKVKLESNAPNSASINKKMELKRENKSSDQSNLDIKKDSNQDTMGSSKISFLLNYPEDSNDWKTSGANRSKECQIPKAEAKYSYTVSEPKKENSKLVINSQYNSEKCRRIKFQNFPETIYNQNFLQSKSNSDLKNLTLAPLKLKNHHQTFNNQSYPGGKFNRNSFRLKLTPINSLLSSPISEASTPPMMKSPYISNVY